MKAIITFLLLFSLFLNANAFQKDSDNEFVIASLNLLYGTPADLENTWKERKNRAIANLQEYKNGIICLQEVNETQIKDVTKGVSGLDVVYRTNGKTNDNGKANAIFYNKRQWKLIEEETFWLSDTPDVPASKGWGNTLPRIATMAVLESKGNGERIRIMNALLDHRSEESRMKSVSLILEKVDSYPDQYSTVLVGDFNAIPQDPVIAKVLNDYTDTYSGPKLEGCTYHDFHGGKNCPRIDYVFSRTKDGLKLNNSGIDRFERNKMFSSDHYLVYAKFSWQ